MSVVFLHKYKVRQFLRISNLFFIRKCVDRVYGSMDPVHGAWFTV
jgi:hypothetical protein